MRRIFTLDRMVNGILFVVFIVAIASFGLNVATLRSAGGAENASEEVARGTRISSCRVLWADDVEFARAEFLIAMGDVQDQIARGLAAVAVGDDGELLAALDDLAAARQAMRARRVELRVSIDERLAANQLALANPREFLDLCRARTEG